MDLLPPHPPAVLVVDDDRVPRQVVYRLLTEEGFRVFEAGNAREALDVLGMAPGRIDLVITDVVMPGCDGVELGRLIHEQWPEQRLLYMSAHPAEVVAEHGLQDLDVLFLAKPFTRDEILAKVRAALTGPRPRPSTAEPDGPDRPG